MTTSRKALIVAVGEYEHSGLNKLDSAAADAEALHTVLSDSQIGGFDVDIVRDESSHVIARCIEDLFVDAKGDDVVLLHFSGHGLKGEAGDLFFAGRDTLPNRLASTAVAASFVQRCMRSSPSRSIVLLLDCCYGGAFGQGVTFRAASDMHVFDSFPAERLGTGRGRAVISASNAMEYAFEGDRLSADGRPRPSLFTAALVEGLTTGEADRDEDGLISLSELYDYVFDRVRAQNVNQTPSRDITMQGELYVAKSGRRRLLPAPLPLDLRAAVEDANPYTRLGAVAELGSRLVSDSLTVAAGARETLLALASSDTQLVAGAAEAALKALVLGVTPHAMQFGSIPVSGSSPAQRVELTGPALARAVTVRTSAPWIRVDAGAAAYEIAVTRPQVPETGGTVTFSGPAGDVVVDIAVAATDAATTDAGTTDAARPDREAPERRSTWAPVAPGRRWSRWFYATDPAPQRPVAHQWPVATDYVAAVQYAPVPLRGADLADVRLIRDESGMPESSRGQSAIVFELGHGPQRLALRCFLKAPDDAADRYRKLASTLADAGCDVVVPARWVEGAVEVHDRPLPAVVMPWDSGLPLNAVVEGLLGQPSELKRLAERWLDALSAMAAAGLSHGDLQCGNILVDDEGEIHLVDLDGFYLPDVAPPAELGHADFQHPRRAARDWNLGMDGFSGLVIMLGLLALAGEPELWSFHSGENLILASADYRLPGKTPVWTRLRQSSDPDVLRLTELLERYCAAARPPAMADVLPELRGEAAPVAQQAADPPNPHLWWDQPAEQATEVALAEPRRAASWMARNSIVTGLTSGLACAAVIIAIFAVISRVVPAVVQAPLLVALAGALLAGGLAGIPRITMGAWQSGTRAGLAGTALGSVLALVALGGFEVAMYHSFDDETVTPHIIAAWTLCALAIGVASGLVRRSRRAVVSGVLGGLGGGVLGGIIHAASAPHLVGVGDGQTWTLELNVLAPATAVAILLACAAIGLAIGAVDRVRRRSWLTVIEGSLRGREVILDQLETVIGAADSATLRLTGGGVEPTHAVLLSGHDGYELRCHGRVDINGETYSTSEAVSLNSGDVLRIGGSFVRFERRAA